MSWPLRWFDLDPADTKGNSTFFHEAERAAHNYQDTPGRYPLISKNVLFFLGFTSQGHKNPNTSQEFVVSGI